MTITIFSLPTAPSEMFALKSKLRGMFCALSNRLTRRGHMRISELWPRHPWCDRIVNGHWKMTKTRPLIGKFTNPRQPYASNDVEALSTTTTTAANNASCLFSNIDLYMPTL